jgi:hypothetical protein
MAEYPVSWRFYAAKEGRRIPQMSDLCIKRY